jgi:hypothetical protein
MERTVYSVSFAVSTILFSLADPAPFIQNPCHSEERSLPTAGGRRGIVAGLIHAEDDGTPQGTFPSLSPHRAA